MKEIGRTPQRVNDYRRNDIGYVARIRERLMTRGPESMRAVEQTHMRRVLRKLRPGQTVNY